MFEKVFYQIKNDTCGISSLKSFIYYYLKGKVDLSYEDVFHNSYSLKELKDISLTYGINTIGIKLNESNIKQLKDHSLCLIKSNNVNHYVFFLYIKNDYVYFIDPALGKVKLKIDKFNEIFLGYALIYESIIDKKPYKIKFKFDYSLLIEIICSLPLMLLFISVTYDQYIPFLFIVLYLILNTIKRITLISRMKNFDNKIERIINNNPNLNEFYIKSMYKYKKTYFTLSPTIFAYIFIRFIFLLFLLFLPHGYILAIIFVIFNLIEIMLYKFNKNKINEINYFNNINSLSIKYNLINKMTNIFIKRKEIQKLILSLMFIVLVIIYNFILFNNFSTLFTIIIASIYMFNNEELYKIDEINKENSINESIYKNIENIVELK